MSDIIEQIKDAVVSGKHKEIEGLVRAAIDEKVDLGALINDGLIAAMDIVGKRFGSGEIFLSRRQVAGVNVTYCDDLTISPGISCVAPSLPAAADECEVDFFAGRQRFCTSPSLLCGAFVD